MSKAPMGCENRPLTRDEPIPLALSLVTAVSIGIQVAMWIVILPAAINPGPGHYADFVYIFTAAGLVWSGNGAHIYQASAFNHMPFEALLLSPLALLGYARAYLVLLSTNVILFTLTLRKLHSRWPWALTLCAFLPVGITLVQGQDSIFTLFVLSAAALQLADGGEFRAGAMVGLTLYKPQIGIPICGLMFLWRRWKFVAGFLLTSAACVVASVATVGPQKFLSYIQLLHSMGPKYGIVVSKMVGIRALLSVGFSGRTLFFASVASSAALLLYAFAKGRRIRPQYQLALATAACCLANYHMFTTDLVIVLLPLAVSWEYAGDALLSWSGVALLGLGSIFVFTRQYIIAIPLLLFFFALARQLSASATAPAGRLAFLERGAAAVS